MIVEVKREHIKAGKQLDCQECPVALALYDATNAYYVAVGSTSQLNCIEVGPFDRYRLTRSVERFVRSFDRGEPVKPFRFRLIKENSK